MAFSVTIKQTCALPSPRQTDERTIRRRLKCLPEALKGLPAGRRGIEMGETSKVA